MKKHTIMWSGMFGKMSLISERIYVVGKGTDIGTASFQMSWAKYFLNKPRVCDLVGLAMCPVAEALPWGPRARSPGWLGAGSV